jgi:hypothetical protein
VSRRHPGERPTTFTKEEHADKWLAAQRTDIERETWKGPTVGVTTLRAYAVPWLAQRTTLKPRTADLYQRLLTLHILPTLGDTQLKALTPARVREWHADLSNTTGPTAQAQAYRLLRTICNQAVQDGEIPANPCQIRGAANPRTSERPIPTLAQVHALADLVPDRYRVMILVAAYGGLRFGELTALTQADLLLDDANLPAVTVRKTMSRVKGKWLVGTPRPTPECAPSPSPDSSTHSSKTISSTTSEADPAPWCSPPPPAARWPARTGPRRSTGRLTKSAWTTSTSTTSATLPPPPPSKPGPR